MYFRCGRSIAVLLLTLVASLQGEVVVKGIEIEQKSNGTLITISLSDHLPEEEVTGWFNETGWFYITLHGVSVDSSRTWPFSRTGTVTGFEAHQVSESAQLNFRLKQKVEDFEISSGEDGTVALSLRMPLSESVSVFKEASERITSKEMTVGPLAQLTWQASLPYNLIFLGGGLTAKGALRSENESVIIGILMMAAGWLLNSQDDGKE
ncbi:MAG: hypothetical protein CMG71_05740 [Candidatus Marinimicrobia bacterium]|nr:hypothetical protein [Candidatus Neomarinimicrobiota bacterium]|tara:strand:+ start:3256 stop:3879 length:624 start_codon:yes stop_codon:yes gene_type:complete